MAGATLPENAKQPLNAFMLSCLPSPNLNPTQPNSHTMNTLLKSYDITARIPMTVEARNAGATGRKYWWVLAGRVNATSKRAACAKLRKSGDMPASADKLRAFSR